MSQIIIHVDMDAFYAAVEVRDDPSLQGKPLIIGALPQERGVVATCSYEAREYGIRSGMNIKEAFRRCPRGIFMHPDFEKYKRVSEELHRIWNSYASASEYISLDEAYLDVTAKAGDWEGAREIARLIKERTRLELGLSCSVGLAYSKTAAKIASEEKKPDGYFEILSPKAYMSLLADRDVRVLYTVGEKTAEKLRRIGLRRVRDIWEHSDTVIRLFGKQGQWIVQMARGDDMRPVTPYRIEDAKSISRELTFQEDVEDFGLLKDVLLLLAVSVEERARRAGLHGGGVSLKLTYQDMQSITRSRLVKGADSAFAIYREASAMLEQVEKRPVRLIGAGIYHLQGDENRQMNLAELLEASDHAQRDRIQKELRTLAARYELDIAMDDPGQFRLESIHALAEKMRRKNNP